MFSPSQPNNNNSNDDSRQTTSVQQSVNELTPSSGVGTSVPTSFISTPMQLATSVQTFLNIGGFEPTPEDNEWMQVWASLEHIFRKRVGDLVEKNNALKQQLVQLKTQLKKKSDEVQKLQNMIETLRGEAQF